MVWKATNIANKVGDTMQEGKKNYSREWFQKLLTAFALYFFVVGRLPLIRCVQAFYGRHVSQKNVW